MNAPQALKRGQSRRNAGFPARAADRNPHSNVLLMRSVPLAIVLSTTQNVCGTFLAFVFDDICEACFAVVFAAVSHAICISECI